MVFNLLLLGCAPLHFLTMAPGLRSITLRADFWLIRGSSADLYVIKKGEKS